MSKWVKLKDIAGIYSGGTPSRAKAEYWNGDIPWISSSDLTLGNMNTVLIRNHINAVSIKNSATRLIPKESILVVSRVGVGKVAINSMPLCTSQDFQSIVIHDKTKYSNKFIAFYIQYNTNTLLATNQGTSIMGFQKRELEKLSIPNMSFFEQDTIVSILQTWDNAIEKTEALIFAKEKQFGWFRSNVLTGKVRFKNFSTQWKHQLFKNILHEHKETSTGNELVHSVSVHKGVINQIEHLGRSFAAASTGNYNLTKSGDIIYTKSPTGNFPYGIIKQNKLSENVIISPLYGVFTPRTYALGVILDAYFESSVLTRNYLYPIIQKGAKNTINCTNSTFLSRGLFLPTDTQEEIALAKYITTTKQEINLLKQQAELYRKQKRGLMQKLLSGEWRVTV